MAVINVKTKKQSGIDRKPRVYFTCHPEDFEKYFRKICDDILATHDCAIYYTEDMNEASAPEDRETDLGRNNLFVVPVTFKLLEEHNFVMTEEHPWHYCRKHTCCIVRWWGKTIPKPFRYARTLLR